MTEWPLVSLSDLLTLERRPVEVEAKEQYAEIGVYCFGRGIFHKPSRSGTEVGEKNLYCVRQGDFIFQITFAWEGALAIASESDDGMYASTRFPTFRVDGGKCFSPFLLNYFRTAEGKHQLVKVSPGSAGRNRVLSLKRLSEVVVPLPPLEEQHRIVDRIEELHEKVRTASQIAKQIEEARRKLWMVLARESLTRIGKAPATPLSELITLIGGGTPSKSNPEYWQGSVPWVSPKDMKSRTIRDSADHISDSAIQGSAAKLIQPGVVLIVVRGMILAHTVPSAVLEVPATINQDMKALVPKAGLAPEFLSMYLWAFNPELLALVERSTHDTRKLETKKLLSFHLVVPSPDVQESVCNRLRQLEGQVREIGDYRRIAQREIEALMPSVLNRAFSGQL
jgi:type I restriction enzyme S subunit